MPANPNHAKRIIWEILSRAGGELSKTKLLKAFWLAHLYYAKAARGYLTDWPIVRMPNGPAIDRADWLLQELSASGLVEQTHQARGPFTEVNCRVTAKPVNDELAAAAVEAVTAAVGDVKTRSVEEISEWSHEFSRSWKNTPNGTELDIYSDLIPDDVYESRKTALGEMKKAYEDMFQ